MYEDENSERIKVCLKFCEGFSNEELHEFNSVFLMKAQMESLSGLLLDVRDDSVKQIQLLKKIDHASVMSDNSFGDTILEIFEYLVEKGVYHVNES